MPNTLKRLLVVAATAATIGGAATTNASAYAVSGGAFTTLSSADHMFTIGPYVWRCSAVSSSGNATGSATVTFSSVSFSGCNGFGFPSPVVQTNPWTMTVSGGPTAGVYTSTFDVPSGTTTTYPVPVVFCTVTMSGPQSFATSSTATNTASGARFDIDATGVAFTASGCPFSSGNYATYKGSFVLPGITVS